MSTFDFIIEILDTISPKAQKTSWLIEFTTAVGYVVKKEKHTKEERMSRVIPQDEGSTSSIQQTLVGVVIRVSDSVFCLPDETTLGRLDLKKTLNAYDYGRLGTRVHVQRMLLGTIYLQPESLPVSRGLLGMSTYFLKS
ncbi:hypothetical protein CBL_01642 [Carabus blaptoides fortunei]